MDFCASRHAFLCSKSPRRNSISRKRSSLQSKPPCNRQGVAVFPELGLSAYSNDDLFFQDALLDAARQAIAESRAARAASSRRCSLWAHPSRPRPSCSIAPSSFIAAASLGVVPKTYLPNYREFYEKRQFTSGSKAGASVIRIGDETVPFGNDLIFSAENYPDIAIHVEICEDLWVPIPPSSYAALAGATVLANLSASNITVAKADYRRLLCASQSAKCVAAYRLCGGGLWRIDDRPRLGRAWDDLRERRSARRDGALLQPLAMRDRRSRSGAFAPGPGADDELQRLRRGLHRDRIAAMRRVPFEFEVPAGEVTP